MDGQTGGRTHKTRNAALKLYKTERNQVAEWSRKTPSRVWGGTPAEIEFGAF